MSSYNDEELARLNLKRVIAASGNEILVTTLPTHKSFSDEEKLAHEQFIEYTKANN